MDRRGDERKGQKELRDRGTGLENRRGQTGGRLRDHGDIEPAQGPGHTKHPVAHLQPSTGEHNQGRLPDEQPYRKADHQPNTGHGTEPRAVAVGRRLRFLGIESRS